MRRARVQEKGCSVSLTRPQLHPQATMRPYLKTPWTQVGGTVIWEWPCHDGMFLALVSTGLHIPLGAFQKRNIVPAWCCWLPQTCVYLDFSPWFLCLHCGWEDRRYLSIPLCFIFPTLLCFFTVQIPWRHEVFCFKKWTACPMLTSCLARSALCRLMWLPFASI